jgi:hypothetical protein
MYPLTDHPDIGSRSSDNFPSIWQTVECLQQLAGISSEISHSFHMNRAGITCQSPFSNPAIGVASRSRSECLPVVNLPLGGVNHPLVGH